MTEPMKIETVPGALVSVDSEQTPGHWEGEARRYANNSDYWQDRFDKSEANNKRLREGLVRLACLGNGSEPGNMIAQQALREEKAND